MIKTLTSAFKNKDIRKKLLYTLMMLVVIRIGSLLPIPGVDTEYFSTLLSGFNSGDLSYQVHLQEVHLKKCPSSHSA